MHKELRHVTVKNNTILQSCSAPLTFTRHSLFLLWKKITNDVGEDIKPQHTYVCVCVYVFCGAALAAVTKSQRRIRNRKAYAQK